MIVRHKKRGTTYDVLGDAEMQISTGDLGFPANARVYPANARVIGEGDRITVYRCRETGKLWARFPDEFEDGRFEPLPQPPGDTMTITDEMARAGGRAIAMRLSVGNSLRASGQAAYEAWAPGYDETARAALEAASPLIRAAVIEECAKVAEWACMVPPDGGSPTEEEVEVADEAARRIRALARSKTDE